MKKIQIKPVFVKTKNVRNFEVLMDGLALGEGEGRMGVVYGSAGRGKTRTAQWYAANNGCVYLRVATVWKRSELEFLQDLCRALGMLNPPKRKGPCYREALERLVSETRPVFLDEIEKLHPDFLDIVRDLTDGSAAPFVLIGEEELKGMMEVNKRVWSRTYQALEFEAIGASDVMFYAMEAAGLKLSAEVAGIFHRSSDGDFRLVKRSLLSLVQFVNAQGSGPDGNGGGQITEEMARIAVKMGLKGDRS